MAEAQGRVFKDSKNMPFFTHFNELRKRLTNYFIVFALLSFFFYWQPIHEAIMRILFRDVLPLLPGGQFAVMGIFDPMTFRFTVGVYAALVVTSPLLVYHIFAFFAPAMKVKERKWIFPVSIAAGGLFIMGILFAYFLILPTAVEWLMAQHTAYTFEMPRAQDWLAGVLLLLLSFGISFELPLVIFALIGLGIIKYPAIRESWRIAYVGLFVLAAVVTPDRGPITMVALALALIVLYESGLIAARFLLANRVDEQYVDAYEEMLVYDNAPTDNKEKLARRAKLKKQAAAAKKRLEAREKKKSAEVSSDDADLGSDFTEDATQESRKEGG
jgi:sec-independent protein translocase protein TatC